MRACSLLIDTSVIPSMGYPSFAQASRQAGSGCDSEEIPSYLCVFVCLCLWWVSTCLRCVKVNSCINNLGGVYAPFRSLSLSLYLCPHQCTPSSANNPRTFLHLSIPRLWIKLIGTPIETAIRRIRQQQQQQPKHRFRNPNAVQQRPLCQL